MDVGLLLLRLLLAGILLAHAGQKALGWFSGPGMTGATAVFDKLGQHPPRAMVYLAVSCETVAAGLLGTGLATPLGAAVATGTMLVAGRAMTRLAGTPWNAAGGGEYPYVLGAVAAVLAFTGPGSLSLDAITGAPWHNWAVEGIGVWLGLASLLVALLAALTTFRAAAS